MDYVGYLTALWCPLNVFVSMCFLCSVLAVWPCIVGSTAELTEHIKVLVQSITIDRALPALDWSAVMSPVLHSDICRQSNS